MWDLWVYRENVGWWLEESGFDEIDDVAGHVHAFRHEHRKPGNETKFQFAIVPHGVPMAVAKFNH